LFPAFIADRFAVVNTEINNILEKVTALYLSYGIKSVTMDDVSRELGISKKTLYLYFSDKNDLVKKAIDKEIERIHKGFNEIIRQNLNAIDEILEFNKMASRVIKTHSSTALYDLKKYYPDLHENIIRIWRENMYDMILKNLQKGKSQGLFRKDLNEEVIAKLHVSRLMVATDNDLFTHEELVSHEVAREMYIYHIHGIANARGLEILEKSLKKNEINI
jgi:AcrR family transcriptional regulator